LEQQDAKITLKPGEPLDPEAIRDAVKKVDFKPREMRIKAAGELLIKGKILMLKIPDTGQAFQLTSPAEAEKGDEKKTPETTDLLKELRKMVKNGQKNVNVSGEVIAEKDAPLQLRVEKYEVIQNEH